MAAALLLSACSSGGDGNGAAEKPVDAETRQMVERMSGARQPAASTPDAKPFERSEETDLLDFVYAYPAQAAAVPALVARFDKDLTHAKADALKMARTDSAAAKKSGYPYRKHSLETRWTVQADTPRLLALESATYIFTGGAHGMTGYKGLIWDKARKNETSMDALMTSKAAFSEAIRSRFCAELDRQRAQKRGEPVKRGDGMFSDCIDPMKEVIVPTSKDGKLIDSMTVVVGPYSAGPYAEGTYEVTLPVDAAMRNAIKSEYRDAFVG